MNDFETKKSAYINYKELERRLGIEVGNTNTIENVYNYIKNSKDCKITNEQLEEGWFDFEYKDMYLTINKNSYGEICKLCDCIELWDNDSCIGYFLFENLEKEVLEYDYNI